MPTMQTRSKARSKRGVSPEAQAPSQGRVGDSRSSPDWEMDSNGDLPNLADEAQSPFVPSISPSPSIPPVTVISESSDNDEDQLPDQPLNAAQSQNARSARWLAWQDRSLVQAVERHRPFNAARGDATRDAWDSLAVELLRDSTINGTAINRTGPACRARFLKLLKAHNADQTRSLQKTGTDEEVDAHIELLTQVAELVQARVLEKDEKSTVARKKADVETRAALELRDSAMKGLVRREALTDVAALEGASMREKQGQRKRRRSKSGSKSDKENSLDIVEPKPKRRRNQLTEILSSRNATDAKRLEQARKIDQERHSQTIALQQQSLALQENMVAGLGQLSQGIGAVASAQAKLMEMETKRTEEDSRVRYEESERRRVDAERRLAEAERHASLLAALSRKDW
ncbi:hypothetical protein B0H19DRAFT_1271251 [Mycena capillaripes]|nr:hypothetical protein B0H19DRAFT_1271251 [Mycena capillaripes]